MNQKEYSILLDSSLDILEEFKKIKNEVYLSKSLSKKNIESYLEKNILNKDLKEVKIIFKTSYIDFYKNYNGVEVKLLRLLIQTPLNVPFSSPNVSFINFNLITYNGDNSEDWEYQKLIDVGKISYKILNNKTKILKKLSFFHKKERLNFNKIKNNSLKLMSQFDKKEALINKSIVQRMEYCLKSSILDLSKLPQGYLPFVVHKEKNIIKNVTSLELVKNSKYKIKYVTTELNTDNTPIIWEVKTSNLKKHLANQIKISTTDYFIVKPLFPNE